MILNQNVTYCKAVAIILMVLGHCCGQAIPYCTQTIYMFHIPLFFFLSGFCFKNKYLANPEDFVIRRFKGLWWPFVKWSLIFMLLHNFFVEIGFYGTQCGAQSDDGLYYRDEYIMRFLDIVFDMSGNEQLLGGYWFLNALLGGALIAFVLLCIRAKIKNYNIKITPYLVDFMILGLLIILMMLTNEYTRRYCGVIFPRTLLAAIMFICGSFIAEYKLQRFNWLQSILAFSVVVIGGFYWRLEPASYFFEGMTMNIPLYIITALLGTWVIYSLPWYLIREGSAFAKLIDFIGNNTLTILTWHFVWFKFVSFILIKVYHLPDYNLSMFPTITEYSDKGWWFVYFGVGVTCPLLSLLIINKIGAALKRYKKNDFE